MFSDQSDELTHPDVLRRPTLEDKVPPLRDVTQRPVRVLMLGAHSPDVHALGGVEIHLADLALHMGSSVQVYAAHLRGGRLVIETFQPVRRELAVLPASDLAGAVTTALLALEADIFHIHSPQVGALSLAQAAEASGARVVLTLHDGAWSEFEARRLVDTADLVIAPSQFIRDSVARAHPCVVERTRLVRWGVPPQEVARSASDGGRCRDGMLRVAFVGVLAVHKGVERLPDLIRGCACLDLEWHLFGASEGRSLRAIRRAAPNVRVHGAYRRTELGRLLADAGIDVAIIPSIVPESFSMTLSECISAGVPVAASNMGAFVERIRDEDCGWLFDPFEPESLAATLAELKDRRKTLSPRELPTPLMMAKEHERLYTELAGAGRRTLPDVEASELARSRYAAARRPGESTLRRAWRAVRRSKFYRELPLRRLLPERVRLKVELLATALLDRLHR